ncbi:MAG TPA: DUF4200 domain-containing protein [Alphaproteobacteria bacterium]|nr:DUF4200 domain-containing protein [Alphaproteobacteria bacterium]
MHKTLTALALLSLKAFSMDFLSNSGDTAKIIQQDHAINKEIITTYVSPSGSSAGFGQTVQEAFHQVQEILTTKQKELEQKKEQLKTKEQELKTLEQKIASQTQQLTSLKKETAEQQKKIEEEKTKPTQKTKEETKKDNKEEQSQTSSKSASSSSTANDIISSTLQDPPPSAAILAASATTDTTISTVTSQLLTSSSVTTPSTENIFSTQTSNAAAITTTSIANVNVSSDGTFYNPAYAIATNTKYIAATGYDSGSIGFAAYDSVAQKVGIRRASFDDFIDLADVETFFTTISGGTDYSALKVYYIYDSTDANSLSSVNNVDNSVSNFTVHSVTQVDVSSLAGGYSSPHSYINAKSGGKGICKNDFSNCP